MAGAKAKPRSKPRTTAATGRTMTPNTGAPTMTPKATLNASFQGTITTCRGLLPRSVAPSIIAKIKGAWDEAKTALTPVKAAKAASAGSSA